MDPDVDMFTLTDESSVKSTTTPRNTEKSVYSVGEGQSPRYFLLFFSDYVRSIGESNVFRGLSPQGGGGKYALVLPGGGVHPVLGGGGVLSWSWELRPVLVLPSGGEGYILS